LFYVEPVHRTLPTPQPPVAVQDFERDRSLSI
jgi:hypothetical protein